MQTPDLLLWGINWVGLGCTTPASDDTSSQKRQPPGSVNSRNKLPRDKYLLTRTTGYCTFEFRPTLAVHEAQLKSRQRDLWHGLSTPKLLDVIKEEVDRVPGPS